MEEKPPVLTNFKSSVGSGITNASQLAFKSSERSSLRSSLASDYLALGKELFTTGQHQADLKAEYHQLQELSAKITAAREPVTATGQSYLDQAKVMAIKAKRFAEEKVLNHQTDNALQRLGETAYKKYGSLAGSEGLSKSIAEKLAKIESLDSEIAYASGQLKANFNSSVSSGGEAAKKFFSKRPNQIVAGVIAVCLVGFAVSKSGTGEAGKPEQTQVVSSPVEINANFIPHKPGAIAKYEIDTFGKIAKHEHSYKSGGKIWRQIKWVGDLYTGSLAPTIYTHKLSGGYVGHVSEDGTWTHRLKIGAKVGDSWEYDGLVYTVDKFDDYRIKYDGKSRRSVTINVTCKSPSMNYYDTFVDGIGLLKRIGTVENSSVNWRLNELDGGISNKNLIDAERKFFE